MTHLSEPFDTLQAAVITPTDLLRYTTALVDQMEALGEAAITEEMANQTNEALLVLGLFLAARRPRPTDEEGERLVTLVKARVREWKQNEAH